MKREDPKLDQKSKCDACPAARKLASGGCYCPYFSCQRDLYRVAEKKVRP